jgi:hypothetical protein
MYRLRLIFAAIVVLCAACAPDDPAGPVDARAGGIAVSVATQGDSLDPDGYLVVVTNHGAAGSRSTRKVSSVAELTFPSMAPGQYDVALEDLAQHCKLQDSTLATQRVAVVTAGEISRLAFSVVCSTKTPGRLRVTVRTTHANGATFEYDFFLGYSLLIDDRSVVRVKAYGVTEVATFPPGLHTVGLKASNCSVGTDGTVPPAKKTATIRMPPGGFAEVKFAVRCTP